MSLYEQYETDIEAENEGVYHPFAGGFKLRLARAGGGNVKYMQAIAERAEQFQSLDRAALAESGVMAEVYSEAVVTDIEDPDDNFVTKEGEKITLNSPELVKAFRDLPEFWLEVQKYATNRAYYKPLNEETTSKK